MPILLVRHRVQDYDTWRRVFQDEAETRRANGSRQERQLRNASNPSEVWLLLEWDDLFRAQLYASSEDMRAALVRAGVIDHPDYWYLEDTDPDAP